MFEVSTHSKSQPIGAGDAPILGQAARVRTFLLLSVQVRALKTSRATERSDDGDAVEGRVGGTVAPRLSRCRSLRSDGAGMGAAPHRWAKAASDRRRSGLSPTAVRSRAAVSGPTPWMASTTVAVDVAGHQVAQRRVVVNAGTFRRLLR